MNGNYLIPANTKKGQLILGLFRTIDLGIFLTGVIITFVLLMIIPMNDVISAIIIMAPVLVCTTLVAPIPYYHNVLSFIVDLYQFLTGQQKYIWKGWCFVHDTVEDKKNSGRMDR